MLLLLLLVLLRDEEDDWPAAKATANVGAMTRSVTAQALMSRGIVALAS